MLHNLNHPVFPFVFLHLDFELLFTLQSWAGDDAVEVRKLTLEGHGFLRIVFDEEGTDEFVSGAEQIQLDRIDFGATQEEGDCFDD